MKRFFAFAIALALMLAAPAGMAWAHAFPDQAEPGAGAELDRSPEIVIIRFDRALEPLFSMLRVKNEAGKRVDRNDSQLTNGRNDTLQVRLLPLDSGHYHVYWTAVARDGHRTQGDYVFVVH